MSLKSDVIITPVKMYFATSIRKSANFSCRWFTLGSCSALLNVTSCLFVCGFDFSRRVLIGKSS
ncbi:MAG: hypothetical protein IJ551_09245 [Prevotella sp.]|nr:hypothetical protein [Prevotella sp.]